MQLPAQSQGRVVSIKVMQNRSQGGGSWKWEASYRPAESERITVGGFAWTRPGAFRKARRAVLDLVRVSQGGER